MTAFHKYPKLLLLGCSMTAAYVLYAAGGLHFLHGANGTSEYLAAFIGGIFFSFGFTTPFGIGIFVEIGPAIDPLLGAMIGGAGALLSDLAIFHVMHFEFFADEIHHVRSLRVVTWVHGVLHHERFPQKLREYLLWSFAGVIIASPFPDELGVALVSSLTDIKRGTFIAVSLLCNTVGILLMILGSRILN